MIGNKAHKASTAVVEKTAGVDQWRGRSIRARILLCFGVMLAATALSITIAISTIGRLGTAVDKEMGGAVTRLIGAGQVRDAMSDMKNALRGVILFNIVHRPEPVQENVELFRRGARTADTQIAKLLANTSNDHDREVLEAMQKGIQQWATSFEEAVKLAASGQTDVADAYSNTNIRPVIVSTMKLASQYVADQQTAADASKATAAESGRFGYNSMIVAALCCLIAGAWTLLVLNRVTGVLKQIATLAASGAEQVSRAAKEIESSSQALAQGSSEQAASIEETSAASHEIDSLASRNTANSKKAAEVAEQSSQRHQQSVQSVNAMIDSTQRIKESSAKVASILKVVDMIAFQTNILALNAAVEAARAGEAGQGFAVVADEVRNLAQQCAKAAQEIAVLIDQSVSLSNEGDQLANNVASLIHALIGDATNIHGLLGEIHGAVAEQARGTSQIAISMQQLGQVTQSVAAQAEESAAASTELSAQALELERVAEQLAVMAGNTTPNE